MLHWIASLALVLLVSCAKAPDSREPEASVLANDPAESAPGNDLSEAAITAELTQTVRKYGAEQQRVPADLDELVRTGYLRAIPPAPPGKKFAIDRKMQVYLADQ